jgi:hypothetical protein
MRRLIFEVTIPELPPSDNDLYFYARGKTVLSKVGKAFKNGVKETIKQAWESAGMPGIEPDQMLEFELFVRHPHVFTRTEEAKNRFVKLDARNRGKLIEDAFVEHLGLDDSQHFQVHYYKLEGPPAVHLRLFENEEVIEWPGS